MAGNNSCCGLYYRLSLIAPHQSRTLNCSAKQTVPKKYVFRKAGAFSFPYKFIQLICISEKKLNFTVIDY